MQVEKIEIDKLIYDPNNARKHPDKNIMDIKGSLAKFGQQKPIVVDYNNIIIAGNGTVKAAKELGWTEINIVRSDLTGFNATAFGLADNHTSDLSEWDEEIRNSLLKGLDSVEFDLTAIGFDLADWNSSIEENKESSEDTLYTKKIEIPIYEPKGDKPALKEIFNCEKTKILLDEINASTLSEDEKDFLRKAAYRHTVFNFQGIAEYYAHSNKEVQNLMEKSALVIIAFNKAIEYGFVTLTKDLVSDYKISNQIDTKKE